jgi:hypothetical protein
MTQEELEYYSLPKLQKLFREKMGEWRANDKGKFLNNDPEIITKYLLLDLTNPETLEDWKNNWIRLPLPIDPENPERGLWGMVDWRLWNPYISGGMETMGLMNLCPHEPISTPTLALLKALAHQEGIEI